MSRVGRTRSIALVGMSGAVVEVEADIGSQLPAFHLIGLPDAALGEARERVRSACANSGLALPARKLTVNLSPAALPKHGSGFDLAIALTALAACGEVNVDSVAAAVHLGELGLDGRVRPTPGVLPAVLAAAAAGCARVYVPTANVAEASLVSGIEVVPVASLREAAQRHGATLEDEPDPGDDAGAVEGAGARPEVAASIPRENGPEVGDLADIVGNMAAVDALILAAAGGHHLLLLGPPGAGRVCSHPGCRGSFPTCVRHRPLMWRVSARSPASRWPGASHIVRRLKHRTTRRAPSHWWGAGVA